MDHPPSTSPGTQRSRLRASKPRAVAATACALCALVIATATLAQVPLATSGAPDRDGTHLRVPKILE